METLFNPMLNHPTHNERLSSFVPAIPKTLADLNLDFMVVESLVLKSLSSKGAMRGRDIAVTLCLHFLIVEGVLGEMKNRLLLTHQSATGVGDFVYTLTQTGEERAIACLKQSGYTGAVPVAFNDYLIAVQQQSIRHEKPDRAALQKAFNGLIIDENLLETLGPAANSGRGLFLYGEPGNGKTSIAECLARCFKETLYIPKTLSIDGQLIQLFDPQMHSLVDLPQAAPQADHLNLRDSTPKFDQRWVKIKRPAVMVGGELTMEALDIKYNPVLKLSEAPLQMKANGGIFLIDDFGRQRISHIELLNRWIVPLEKQIDFLTLPNGQKVAVPFDQLIIFSTNLEPRSLVDDAFLRRVPYKVYVGDPSEEDFIALFRLLCEKFDIPFDLALVNDLITTHYRGKRPFRGCQPRDILQQVLNVSAYLGIPAQLSKAVLDRACQNYFGVMETSVS
jgi:predicted ATPase with chaperone activity